jgi:hypothetical protein
MQRRPQRDPVTPATRELVLQRDLREYRKQALRIALMRPSLPSRAGCVAVFLDPLGSGPCSGPLTLDHVKDFAMMGKRAPSDQYHLVTICLNHHVENHWATSHRAALREYLRSLYGARP